jgi:DNA polymerase-3 subunit alpha
MIGGYVQEARVMKSKSGRPMAFATIDDSTGTMEISMFDHVDEFEEFFQVGRIIIATGTTKLSTYQNTNGQTVMQAMKIIDIEEARKEYSKGLRIDIEESLLTKSRAKELRDLILKFRDGPFPLELCYHSANARIIMEPDPCRIDPSDEFLNGVRLLFGKDSVSLKF